ncbi:hypothetical protein F2Q70_00033574 [Brassica cretica]|uniref:Uncharacterized protein n=1 Tax=Brassica cretica TaxID=69181 RepID=A0A8S9FG77_BRACR|nr:hypothetical protein F2Q70_00033574 [Brassica cretica]
MLPGTFTKATVFKVDFHPLVGGALIHPLRLISVFLLWMEAQRWNLCSSLFMEPQLNFPARLEAHKARTQTRKNSRTIPSLPSHGETRPQRWNRVSEPSAFDWNREKEFRVNYGARKELSSREGSSRIEPKGPFISRTPARERLSFRRDSSEVHRGTVSNNVTSTPRQTWRPVAEGSRKGNSDSQGMSQVSHTPSPRPQREEESLQRAITNRENQNSGNGSARSSERRSAHGRLSLPSPRIPLLQDGVANPKSGRLQEVPIQVLEDNPPCSRLVGFLQAQGNLAHLMGRLETLS